MKIVVEIKSINEGLIKQQKEQWVYGKDRASHSIHKLRFCNTPVSSSVFFVKHYHFVDEGLSHRINSAVGRHAK